MITWITENVAIGEFRDGINEELLRKEKIDCVLNLRSQTDLNIVEDTINLETDIEYVHIPIGRNYWAKSRGEYFVQFKRDMKNLKHFHIFQSQLKVASQMLEYLTMVYKRILVHCTAGMDRAPFVVAYWIVTKSNEEHNPVSNMSKEDLKFCIANAYKFIKKRRPQVIEHMEWV